MSAPVWKWESDDGSVFNEFNASDTAFLENAFGRINMQDPSSHIVSHPARPWMFDLKAMTQLNTSTSSKRRITREAIVVTQRKAAHAATDLSPHPSVQHPNPSVQVSNPTAPAQLPAGWTMHNCDGKPFYVSSTGHSQWDLPAGSVVAPQLPQAAASPPPPSALPAGWKELTDPKSNRTYYCNTITMDTTWDRPGGVGLQPAVQAVQANQQQTNQQAAQHQANQQQANQQAAQQQAGTVLPPYVLPAPWIELQDQSSGRVYYANPDTRQTQYERPTAAPVPVPHVQVFPAQQAAGFSQGHHPGAQQHVGPQQSAAIPPNPRAAAARGLASPPQVLWRWESDDSLTFNDFSGEHCRLLEQAFKSGQPQFQIPERQWVFDFKKMLQSKIGGTDRRIMRLESSPSSAATIPVQPQQPHVQPAYHGQHHSVALPAAPGHVPAPCAPPAASIPYPPPSYAATSQQPAPIAFAASSLPPAYAATSQQYAPPPPQAQQQQYAPPPPQAKQQQYAPPPPQAQQTAAPITAGVSSMASLQQALPPQSSYLQQALPPQSSYHPPAGPPPSGGQNYAAPPGPPPAPSAHGMFHQQPPPPMHQSGPLPAGFHQQPPPPMHQSGPLPAGWREEPQADGRVMYCHDALDRQTFTRPN